MKASARLAEILAHLRGYRGRLKVMEVCGTHTSAIFKHDIRSLISDDITLVSGPGCPACVTPPSTIDMLAQLAHGAVVLCFGDMFNIPGGQTSLAQAKAGGADVRLIYSPLQAVQLAQAQPQTRFIVAAVGFETTAPVYAALLETLSRLGICNVQLYTALRTIPEALAFICDSEEIDAFICPGHVSAVIGAVPYRALAHKYGKPFVIAGFEAEHIIAALYEIVRQCDSGTGTAKNLYPSVVRDVGQEKALSLMEKYFEKTDAFWRGIGVIESSGYILRQEYAHFSANLPEKNESVLPQGCRCTDVLLGRIMPQECALFGGACTPRSPIGPCMASPEGACGVYGGAL
jgi:hydrogenase expression/formation protein HypD